MVERGSEVFIGFEWKRGKTCLALKFFEARRMLEKEEKGRINALYRVEHQKPPAVRLKLLNDVWPGLPMSFDG